MAADVGELRMLTWNAWWAHCGTARGKRVAAVLAAADVDVIVLTEAEADVLPEGGYIAEAIPDWGYRTVRPGRRKVLLWSKHPWTDIDQLGSERFPSGRWVAATTRTPIGTVRVAGVCIPWASAHVTTGQKNRRNWEDHRTYLDALKPVLDAQLGTLVVAGDFNQRIPRGRQPIAVFDALVEAFRDMRIATDSTEPPLIDHIAHSHDVVVSELTVLPAADEIGNLSDHSGVVVTLTRNP